MGILHYADKDVERGDLKLHPEDHALDPIIKFVTFDDVESTEIVAGNTWDPNYSPDKIKLFHLKDGVAKRILDWMDSGFLVCCDFDSHSINPDIKNGDKVKSPIDGITTTFQHFRSICMFQTESRNLLRVIYTGKNPNAFYDNNPGRAAMAVNFMSMKVRDLDFVLVESKNDIVMINVVVYAGEFDGYQYFRCTKVPT